MWFLKKHILHHPKVKEKNNIVISSVNASNCRSEATNKYHIGVYTDSGKE